MSRNATTGLILWVVFWLSSPTWAQPPNVYEWAPTSFYLLPVQPYYVGIDYRPASSQFQVLVVPNVKAGDVIEAHAIQGIALNGLPYPVLVAGSLVLTPVSTYLTQGPMWGRYTEGEDVRPERPYYMMQHTQIFRITQDLGDCYIYLRMYAGSELARPGDALVTMWVHGAPMARLSVKRWPAQ